MQRACFLLDSTGERAIEGFDSGESWNGFACPYFTFDQAQDLIQVWRENGWEAFYDADADAFTFSTGNDWETGEAAEFESFPAVLSNDVKRYFVGAWCWAWEKAQGVATDA